MIHLWWYATVLHSLTTLPPQIKNLYCRQAGCSVQIHTNMRLITAKNLKLIKENVKEQGNIMRGLKKVPQMRLIQICVTGDKDLSVSPPLTT